MLASGSGKEIDEGFRIGRQNDLNQNYQEETEKLRSTSSGGFRAFNFLSVAAVLTAYPLKQYPNQALDLFE